MTATRRAEELPSAAPPPAGMPRAGQGDGGGMAAGAARRLLDRLAAGGDPLLDLLLEGCPSALLVLDADGRLLRANGLATRLLGRHAMLGLLVLDLFAADARAEAAAALRLALTHPAPARFVARLALDAEERHVAAAAIAVPEPDRPPAGCLLYLTDITRGRALETELAQGQKLQAVGQLAGGIAHDFNNLLTTISNGADLILSRGGGVDAETVADASHIQASAQRGSALVRQLLAFSRQQTPAPQTLPINAAIRSLTDMLCRLLGSRLRLELELAMPDALALMDPTQFDQVLVNLALNARAAMADGGTLTVRTTRAELALPTAIGPQTIPAGRYCRIDVQDTGTGIPPEVLPRIFEPFFTTRAQDGGTGLGLSTVRKIVRESGGYLTVESPPGRGACFCIFLPIAIAIEPAAGAPPAPAAAGAAAGAAAAEPGGAAIPPAAAGATVLLVDDEEGVLAVAARALRQRGWQVIAFPSAEAALAKADMPRPAAVVSDVVMPGMDGPALVRALRARWPGLPAILVSGYAASALRLDLATAEVRFLPKPYTLRALAEALDAVATASPAPRA